MGKFSNGCISPKKQIGLLVATNDLGPKSIFAKNCLLFRIRGAK
jgi:hypothetical protein